MPYPSSGADVRAELVNASGLISSSNPLPITLIAGTGSGTISTANSSTATLGGGAAFTGTAEEVTGYAEITVSVISNVASAAGGLSFQFSSDSTNWDVAQAVTVAAATGAAYTLTPQARYFRIVYTNGGSAQGSFRLQTIFRPFALNSAHAVFQDVNGTLTPTTISQRIAADIMVQDPVAGTPVSNRVRAAISMAASGGVGGGSLVGAGVARYAVAHGANPTAITAGNFGALLTNRAGIPFSIGGHPNIITFTQQYTGAQTDAAVVTVSTGTIIVVLSALITCSNANTVNVSARLGLGTANVPAYGSNGIILSHPNIGPGSGVGVGNGAGIIAIGADNEDIRLTISVPTGGATDCTVRYFTIAT